MHPSPRADTSRSRSFRRIILVTTFRRRRTDLPLDGLDVASRRLEPGKRVEAVRKHLGDDMPLMVDANQQWDRPTAQRLCRSFEDFKRGADGAQGAVLAQRARDNADGMLQKRNRRARGGFFDVA